MMEKRFLAYFGHVNIDITLKVGSLPTSGSVKVDSVTENFGGTAGNFALVSSRLGFPFDLYAAVSRRTHESYLKKLEEMGVRTDHIFIENDLAGPMCYLVSDGSDQIAYVVQGPMESWKPSVGFRAEEYEYVHLSTGPAGEYIRIAERAHGKSKVIFDPSQELSYNYDRNSVKEMLAYTDLFIGNSHEMKVLRDQFGVALQDLMQMGVQVIVTHGKEGSTFYSGGDEFSVSSFNAGAPRDTTGAGDSFRAGLYMGLSRNMQMKDSLAMGSVVAAHAITGRIVDFTPDIPLFLRESHALVR
jgi:sugar/nucleoside kinase (ribokinase family)